MAGNFTSGSADLKELKFSPTYCLQAPSAPALGNTQSSGTTREGLRLMAFG